MEPTVVEMPMRHPETEGRLPEIRVVVPVSTQLGRMERAQALVIQLVMVDPPRLILAVVQEEEVPQSQIKVDLVVEVAAVHMLQAALKAEEGVDTVEGMVLTGIALHREEAEDHFLPTLSSTSAGPMAPIVIMDISPSLMLCLL